MGEPMETRIISDDFGELHIVGSSAARKRALDLRVSTSSTSWRMIGRSRRAKSTICWGSRAWSVTGKRISPFMAAYRANILTSELMKAVQHSIYQSDS